MVSGDSERFNGTMRKLTNSTQDVEIVNLGYAAAGKGPYFIRQEGYPPQTSNFKAEAFILLNDGTWMLNLKFLALEESEQERHLLAGIPEVYRRLQEIGGQPVKVDYSLPEGKSREDIQRDIEATMGRIRQRLKVAKGMRLADLES